MRKIKNILISVLVIISFIACGKKEEDKTEISQNKDKKLVIAQNTEARSLDPQKAIVTTTVRVYQQIYNQLVKHNSKMEIEPDLAEKWEQVDPNTLIFTLRKNVKFHNGEILKASDVKFSLERMKKAPVSSFLISEVEKIEVVDDNTVKIVTRKPFGPLLSHLAHPGAAILNEKATIAAGDDYGQHPIGTGPYKFVEWVAGDNIKLESNKEYFRGIPSIKTLVFKTIPEASSRIIGLETGEIDIAYDIDPIDMNKIKEAKNLQLLSGESLGTGYLVINVQKEQLKKKEVRQAIAYAMDVPAIIDAVYRGTAEQADSPLSKKILGYKSSKKYEHNISKAKELLAQAGYPNGFKMSIWTTDTPLRRDVATIFQDQLKEVGITVNVEVMEGGALMDGTGRGDHDAAILGWYTVTGDADYGLYPLFHSTAYGKPGNRSFYSTPEVDSYLDKARNSQNIEERKELYGKVQDIVQDELPMITYAFVNQSVGLNKKISNFDLHPTGYYEIYGVDKN